MNNNEADDQQWSRRQQKSTDESARNLEVASLNSPAEDMLSMICSWNQLPLIDPYSWRLLVWQMGLMVMIVYSALVVPFELAFGMQPNLEHASLIADFIFILDIAVVFHTKIEIVLNNEPVVLGQRDIIARQYIWGHFLIDCVSCMPPPYVEVSREVRFIKLLKLLRIFKLVKVLNNRIKISPTQREKARIFLLGLLIVYFSHLLACAWYGVGLIDGTDSWHIAKGLKCVASDGDNCVAKKLEGHYIASLYWAVMTLTTVGYGDISAVNKFEMAFSSFVMIIGAFFYAVVLGQVTVAFQEMSSQEEPLRDRIKEAFFFCRHHKIDPMLSTRLCMHIDKQWNLYQSFSGYECLSIFPAELRAEVLMSIHRPMIINVAFFELVHEPFVKMILPEMKPQICLCDEWVYREGDVGDCMYFVSQGEFRVHIKYQVAGGCDGDSLLTLGTSFGENAILLRRDLGIRMQSVECASKTQAIVYSLSREAVQDSLEVFPELAEVIETFGIDALAKQRWARTKVRSFRKVSFVMTVDLLQGRGLASKDVSGFSDPFCRVKYFEDGRFLLPPPEERAETVAESKDGGDVIKTKSGHITMEKKQTHHHVERGDSIVGRKGKLGWGASQGALHQGDHGPDGPAIDKNPTASCKTKVMWRNLRPQWNETMQFEIGQTPRPSDAVVLVEVYDKDMVGQDDFMGRVIIKVASPR
jgi:CRP-like cAMP-binding protein